MVISIIGAGSLGKTYGGLLSFHNEVHFLVRSEFAQIQQNKAFTLHFIDQDESVTIENPHVHQHATELPPSDLIIISLKTTDNASLSALLTTCLKPSSIVLIIQNGIGNEEWVSQFTGDCAIVCGVASMGAYREDALNVAIPIIGELRLAPFNNSQACDTIAQLFKQCAPEIIVKIFPSYQEIRWRKLLWNAPFSTLSVIYKQDAYTLASNQPYASIVLAVMNEIVEIAKTQGVSITQDDIQKLLALTKKTKDYYPSMFHDYFSGKPIEKEYILDNVLSLAKQHHIATPMLNMIASHLEKIRPLLR